ncbi:Uncharacterised protein [uncultured Bacteroides sp.]|uniref:hypothetical protein n=1 Tax=Bacteroides cellulolyticus TaxID=2981780 RepID=UPI000822780B|nr:hypothetical protein [Bacteroides cellulolyticus]MCU6771235.1 hypothetical protein [Bacteroides cellulolyticus]SCH65721.1 Uncharacterised protein [uncultured Bacteroides sp.]
MKYLDPKADLTFKKVFEEHPDLVIIFLMHCFPFRVIVKSSGFSEEEIAALRVGIY